MGNVFISFLGTNDYLSCIYYLDDFKLENVRFVQEATIKYCCREWNDEDRILIFTTGEAKKKNWFDNGHIDRQTKKEKKCAGLKSCLNKLETNAKIQQIDIPDGHNESEIWEIFKIVYDNFKSHDSVIFDITHAFRSIPMLAVVLLNYAKVIKNISLSGIYYGAFEVLGSYHEASNLPLGERLAPILDLTAFDQLMDWSLAVDRFLGAGDAKAVSHLAKKAVTPVLKKSKGKDRAASAIKYIADAIDTYTKTLATCRGMAISKSVRHLKKELKKSKDLELVKPFHPLLEHMGKQVSYYENDIVTDGIRAAKWCLEHNLIQQGFTILQEIIITHFIRQLNDDWSDKIQRGIAASAISICLQEKPEDKWVGYAGEHPDITKKYIMLYNEKSELVKVLDSLTQFRNDLNHAGFNKRPNKPDTFAKNLDDLINKTMNILNLITIS